MAVIDEMSRILLCRTVRGVWIIRFISLSLCHWAINIALYHSFEVPGCFIARMNRSTSMFEL